MNEPDYEAEYDEFGCDMTDEQIEDMRMMF